ncbi:MAG: hypothetical protein ABR881_00550 [Candidatus Sulfotelmatobacter sp.]|jgi:hypothetical protein
MSTPTSSNGLNVSGSSPVKVQIGRPADVTALGQKPVAPNSDTPLGESYQPTPVVIRQVDHNALEGSNKGDHRIPAAPVNMDAIKNPPNPRERVGQFPLGKNTPNGPAPISYLGAEGTDQN